MSNAAFNKNYAALIARCKDKQRQIVRTVAMELLVGCTLRSPVDTGRFRANWQANIGSADTTTTGETEKFGGRKYGGPGTGNDAIAARNRAVIERFEPGQRIFLTNSLPYSLVLEYGGYPNPPKVPTGRSVGGFSAQAPAGMVRTTVADYAQYMGRIVKELG